ncbi:hypothetical protein GI374_10055 [Paracoccus sp. S-4012]|uniref:hypothetical protein n=1 Tax=Paracoccus sp. S-4012 TaxID=2665648 RepID=UPI0012AFA3CE|nr:hypothetical protein [Paracoccus sp. S-4012]MRX50782.1 hypothetical protein [Paracoccus sp. S-4012]
MFLRRAALILALPLTLAACDEQMLAGLPGFDRAEEAPAVPIPPVAPQPPAVSPLEVPIEVGGQAVAMGTANAATVDVTAFTARGNAPAWTVAIAGDRATLSREGARDATVTVRKINFAQGVEYAGELGGSVFSLNIRAAECKDGATGSKWPMTAVVRWSGRGYPGCAAPAGSEPAVRAAPAAGAPAS